MFLDLDFLVRREHNQDLLREAEREQLARLALAGRARRDRVRTRALAWLGERLVAWGQHLQEQHSTPPEPSMLQASHRAK